MRQKLLELGANTIATLPKLFKSKNSFDGVCHVHVSDFFDGLKYYGYNIIKEEAVLLCRYFDPQATENINFEKFLFALRGKPNAVDKLQLIMFILNLIKKMLDMLKLLN